MDITPSESLSVYQKHMFNIPTTLQGTIDYSSSKLIKHVAKDRSNILLHKLLNVQKKWLPITSFSVTFLLFCTKLPFDIYCKDWLNMSPSELLLISAAKEVPWALKIVAGLITDIFPILNSKRYIYMALAVLMYSSAWITFSFQSEAFLKRHFYFIVFLAILQSAGLALLDVVNDSLIVATTQSSLKHKIQSKCFYFRSAGVLVGQLVPVIFMKDKTGKNGLLSPLNIFRLGSVLSFYEMFVAFKITESDVTKDVYKKNKVYKSNTNTTNTTNTISSEVNVECKEETETEANITSKDNKEEIVNNKEDSDINKEKHDYDCNDNDINNENNEFSTKTENKEPDLIRRTQPLTTQQTLNKLITVISTPRIFRLIIFIFAICAAPSASMGMFYYISTPVKQHGLGFSVKFMSFLYVAGGAAHLSGNFIYNRYLMKYSVNKVYKILLSVYLILYASQLVLVYRINRFLNLPDTMFVFSEDVFQDALSAMLSVPLQLIIARECPKGIEGTLYAAIVSIANIAGILSRVLSSLFMESFNIVRDEKTGIINFDHLGSLIIVVVLFKFIGLYMTKYLPKN
eukprot:GAHX01002146.1.p1 GENE.GAHX01002146.1~~GAHX01002146.1.p1  ORF type:complete len:572 (+),score=95.21 GAHX01002146.1:41-1756(+)